MLNAFVLIAGLVVAQAASIGVSYDPTTGAYNVTADGVAYFVSAATMFRDSGSNFSTADGSLKLSASSPLSGKDNLGSYTGNSQEWTASNAAKFSTSYRAYDNFVMFSQFFPAGASNTALGDPDKAVSGFPSFDLTAPTAQHGLGFLAYSGDMVGHSPAYGQWGKDDIPGGIHGGPTVAFTPDLQTSFVLSSASSFMAWNQVYDSDAKSLSFGVFGNATSIPAGFSIDTIVYLGSGVNQAMFDWGAALRTRYGKDMAFKARDLTLQYLGYSTDNGAYYYYTTEPSKNYEETMVDIANYAKSLGLPYRWVLLDSWWYPKGKDGGVTEWVADPSVFPDGMDYVFNATGWPIQGHNRYWSSETTYAKQNGGKWDFLFSDGKYEYGLPLTQDFWDFLMHSSKQWGLTTYEQDWLDNEFDRVLQLTNDVNLGRQWLMQMNNGAAKNGIAIQYCMSHTRHIMQSVELPAVTQARASGDYQPGNDQWDIGVTSIFAHALGIAPTKDNYWSTTYQPGSAHYPTRTEPYNRLQAAVSTISSGPVAPSDMIGHSNVDLIMMSCMSDGTLLQPDRPSTCIDSYFLNKAGVGPGPDGGVQSAPSMVSGRQYTNMFVADNDASYDVPLVDLGYASSDNVVVIEANTTASGTMMSGSEKLTAPACKKFDFRLFSIAPVLAGTSYAVVGEVAKWVPVNNARFQDISVVNSGLEVTLRGVPAEKVDISFFNTDTKAMEVVSCTFGQGATATIVMPAKTCQAL